MYNIYLYTYIWLLWPSWNTRMHWQSTCNLKPSCCCAAPSQDLPPILAGCETLYSSYDSTKAPDCIHFLLWRKWTTLHYIDKSHLPTWPEVLGSVHFLERQNSINSSENRPTSTLQKINPLKVNEGPSPPGLLPPNHSAFYRFLKFFRWQGAFGALDVLL